MTEAAQQQLSDNENLFRGEGAEQTKPRRRDRLKQLVSFKKHEERVFRWEEFEVGRVLRQSDHDVVHYAVHRKTGQPYALKISREQNNEKGLAREIEILKECNHQYITRHIGITVDNDKKVVYVLEFSSEVTLEDNLRKCKFYLKVPPRNFIKQESEIQSKSQYKATGKRNQVHDISKLQLMKSNSFEFDDSQSETNSQPYNQPQSEDEETRVKLPSGIPLTYVRFYLANLLVILEFLEKKHIVHRKFDPQHIFVRPGGYLILDQMETATRAHKKIYSGVGSFNYIAPEVLAIDYMIEDEITKIENQGQEKGRSQLQLIEDVRKQLKQEVPIFGYKTNVDLWSFGVMAYEMMHGHHPFESYATRVQINSRLDSFRRYGQGHSYWKRSSSPNEGVSRDAGDLVKSLLRQEPQTRLGYKRVSEVMRHPFFSGINWEGIRNMQATAPPQWRWNIDAQMPSKEGCRI